MKEKTMKKILGLIAILAIFVLTGCDSGEQPLLGTYHCTFEATDFGSTTIVHYENIYIIRSETTVRTYAPDFDENYLEQYRELFGSEGAELDGNYLVITLMLDFSEELLVSHFIEDLIAHGYSCE